MSTPTNALESLHESGTFVLANAHDIGTARLLQALGFPAVATTSSGFAGTLGRQDMAIGRDELVAHASALASSVMVPLSVDAERGFGETPDDVAETVAALARAGAAGCSIEDFDPSSGQIDPVDVAVSRVSAAADAAADRGHFITARADNHFHGVDDLDDTIGRLQRYIEAGARCAYAPGLQDLDQIARVVDEVDAPVNVLLYPNGPSVAQLAAVGVRRVSVGSWLFHAATKAFSDAAQLLRDDGVLDEQAVLADRQLLGRAWPGRD